MVTILCAIEQGSVFIDTSPYYGVNEPRVGLALAGSWREEVSFKQSRLPSEISSGFLREAATWILKNSFSQLRTDYVDSVFTHGPRYDIETPLRDHLDVLVE